MTWDSESSGAPQILAARLRSLMEARGVHQRELARRARLSESSISRLLNGEQTNPTARTLRALAKALDVHVRTLLVEEAREEPAPTAESEEFLLMLYRLIPPAERGRVVGYAEAIALQHRLNEAQQPSPEATGGKLQPLNQEEQKQ